ncbi:putative acyl-CoA dehydrogenase family member 10-like [Capsicum annuum]|uniref:pathogenesis-related protein STH-2 n=1 Tax=Capsicum annuum TaxID=4072 RepID=UPI001FB16F28|nr:pathogenesis-related protein STH-2 [Capsicum annuum]KAF3658567.1 putative acyl-CoA dehydrogenase family member 10-like [Capsicum annuum]
MVVTTFTQEINSPITPIRLFKALILDSKSLIPKLLPQFVENVVLLQGDDGGVGSIEQVNFTKGNPFEFVKHRIDELDKENMVCKYTMIEGDPLGENLEFVSYEIKFEESNNGNCICKMTTNYHGIGDFIVKENDVKDGKDSAMGIYKTVENYLIQNPNLYA